MDVMDDAAYHRSQPTNEQLACAAQAGCRRSFNRLVERFQTRLLNYLQHRSPHSEHAEDILQETFLQAFCSLHTYDPRWRVSTWLFTIAKRIDARTRRQTARIAVTSLDANNGGPQVEPDTSLDREESRIGIWQIVRDQVSDDEFSALWMVYVEEMAVAEVARVLQRTYPATKMMLSRARRKLRTHLAPVCSEDAVAGESPADNSANQKRVA